MMCAKQAARHSTNQQTNTQQTSMTTMRHQDSQLYHILLDAHSARILFEISEFDQNAPPLTHILLDAHSARILPEVTEFEQNAPPLTHA